MPNFDAAPGGGQGGAGLRDALEIEIAGVAFFDTEGRITDANGAFLCMTGYSREDLAARCLHWEELAAPGAAPQGLPALQELKKDGRIAPHEAEYRRKDGSRFWVACAARVLDGDGGVAFVLDITGAKRTEAALRETEARFNAVLDLVPEFVWGMNPEGNAAWHNRRWQEYTGQTQDQVQNDGWLEAIHPDDQEATLHAFREGFKAGRPFERRHRIRLTTGEYRWFLVRAEPVRDERGTILQWVGAGTDVGAPKRAEEPGSISQHELQHRVRNILAVVRSIARHSTNRQSVQDYTAHLEGRIGALARTHNMLARSPGGSGVAIDALANEELLAQSGRAGRFRLAGPALSLRPKAAETLSLALHELAVNAVKYGALSVPSGRVDLHWGIDHNVTPPQLRIRWSETGVAVLSPEPRQKGFGHDLIERSLPYELGASTTLEFAPGGLRCAIDVPLTARIAAGYPSGDPQK